MTSLSKSMFRTCRLTSLFASSTITFSSFEYGKDERWVIFGSPLPNGAYLIGVSLINCDPFSVMISFGVLNLQECCHRADAADFSVTSVVWNNSMYPLKVSIMTIIWEKPMSVGNRLIVSGYFYNGLKRNHFYKGGNIVWSLAHLAKNIDHKSLELSSRQCDFNRFIVLNPPMSIVIFMTCLYKAMSLQGRCN